MTVLKEKFRTGEVIGLAKFVRTVAPHIDHLTNEKTPRGLFECPNGHTFTAVIKDSKAPRYCRHCNGGDAFTIVSKIKTRGRLDELKRLTESPSFSMSLTVMVTQQNLISEVIRAGEAIRKMSINSADRLAKDLDYQYAKADKKLRKAIDLTIQVLRVIHKLQSEGAPIDAENVKKELVNVLTHE